MQSYNSLQYRAGTTSEPPSEPLARKVVPDPSHPLKGGEGRNHLGRGNRLNFSSNTGQTVAFFPVEFGHIPGANRRSQARFDAVFLLAGIPSGGHTNPSSLIAALALLASLAVVIAVVVLGYWLVFRWLDGETFGPTVTTEPDPIESYPDTLLTNAREPSSETAS